jgi:nitrile hydratase
MSARFRAGERVMVAKRYPPGHVRTPYYCRGKVGVIERVLPAFINPEEEAYGVNEGPRVTLYRVRFRLVDVWPEYRGPARDTLDIEIFEHWLEPALATEAAS